MTSLAWGWFFWLPVTQPWKQADPGPGTWLEALPWDSEHRFPWERSRGRAGVMRAGALPAASLGPPQMQTHPAVLSGCSLMPQLLLAQHRTLSQAASPPITGSWHKKSH